MSSKNVETSTNNLGKTNDGKKLVPHESKKMILKDRIRIVYAIMM